MDCVDCQPHTHTTLAAVAIQTYGKSLVTPSNNPVHTADTLAFHGVGGLNEENGGQTDGGRMDGHR